MTASTDEDFHLWRRCVVRIGDEVRALPASERRWLVERLQQVQNLQRQLHTFFELADGGAHCRDCGGACCEKGRHHLTLVNLLGFVLAEETPPAPDFTATCPFLHETGCCLDVARRPFNCITFNCERVEGALDETQKADFYQLERRLRQLYEAFDRRYAGSSLRGLLIRAERLGERSFLERI